jgi:hypothetical protein
MLFGIPSIRLLINEDRFAYYKSLYDAISMYSEKTAKRLLEKFSLLEVKEDGLSLPQISQFSMRENFEAFFGFK